LFGFFNEAQTLNNQSGNLFYKNAIILKVDGSLQTLCAKVLNEMKSPFPRIEASFRAIKLWRFRKTLASMTLNTNWEDLIIGKMILKINEVVFGINLAGRKDILNCHYFGDSRFQYSFLVIWEIYKKKQKKIATNIFLFTNFYIAKQHNLLDLFV
jgi:hypothetical protein